MKSKDISKFDLDWQVFRVSLKKLKTVDEKLQAVLDFYEQHLNRADRERILNYLEGLSLAYSGKDRKFIEEFASTLEEIKYSKNNRLTFDPEKYSIKELKAVAQDLFVRTKKWLLKGYRHEEQINFLRKLLVYCKDNTKLKELEELIRRSHEIPNTHKFLF